MKEISLHQAAKLSRCPPSQIRFAIRRGWIGGVQIDDDVPPNFFVYWDATARQTLLALGMRSRERDRKRKRRRKGVS